MFTEMKIEEFRKTFLSSSKTRRKPRHIEESIQTACVNWFRYTYPRYIIFAVGNGGSRNKIEAANMKKAGILAGVSDLIIIAGRAVLFVEMKTPKGKQMESQKVFQNNVERLGFEYKICHSLQEFQRAILMWLDLHN